VDTKRRDCEHPAEGGINGISAWATSWHPCLDIGVRLWEVVVKEGDMERIKLFRDGDCWCALYGENIQEGKAEFSLASTGCRWNDTARFDALDALREKYPELKKVPYVNLEE